MAREYKIKTKGSTPKVNLPDDDIPMHRSVGDQFTFPYADRMWVGEVVAVKDVITCLIRADGEMFYERGQDITHLPISAACPHCGQFAFLCNAECPARARKPRKQTDKNMSKKDIINISEVLAIEPGTDDNPAWVNDIVDCVVTNVKEAKGKGPVKATLTNAEDNDDKITGIFWKRDYEDVKEWEGKLVRMEDGMIRSVYKPEKGPRIQQLLVNAKTQIKVVGESAHADKPLPHRASPDRDTPSDAPQRSSGQSGGSLTDVLRRAKCYFGVLLRTEKAYHAAKEAGLELDLTPTDLKDVATHISMTYRSDYGCYAEPIFEKNGSAKPSNLESKPDIPWDDGDQGAHGTRTSPPQSTEKVSSWKSFVHPKRKKPLGDIPDADLMGFARYYIGEEAPDDRDGKLFYANVKMMMAEKGWSSASKLLINSILSDERYSVEFSDDDINGYFEAEAGKVLDDLDDDEAMNFIADYDNVIDGIVKQAGRARKPVKKTKATMPD